MVCDTVTMKQLLKYGCTFDIEDTENNIYFTELIDGKELFKTL